MMEYVSKELIDIKATLKEVNKLMSTSSYYKAFTIEDLQRVTIPCIENGQCMVWIENTNEPFAFVTWAWLNRDAQNAFISRSRPLRPNDILRTDESDHLWIIDIVVLREIRLVITDIRRLLSRTGAYCALFLRRNPDYSIRRVGYIKAIKEKENG